MVYIVVEYPTGYDDYSAERIFTNKIKAYQYCCDMIRCHGDEIEVLLYSANNEYTNKRHLIKKY